MARKKKREEVEESIEVEIEVPDKTRKIRLPNKKQKETKEIEESNEESQPAEIIEISEDMYDARIASIEEQLKELSLNAPFCSDRIPNDESWRLYWGLSGKELVLMAAQRNGQLICLSDAPNYLKRGSMKVLEDMLERAVLQHEEEQKEKKE